jgi:hypothetical protein
MSSGNATSKLPFNKEWISSRIFSTGDLMPMGNAMKNTVLESKGFLSFPPKGTPGAHPRQGPK